jgi:hypothetical protein
MHMSERRIDGLTVGEAARAVPEDLGHAVQDADARLARAMKRTPLLDNLFDWRLVLGAGAFALVIAAVVRLAAAWLMAVTVFLVVFVATVLAIAARRTGD